MIRLSNVTWRYGSPTRRAAVGRGTDTATALSNVTFSVPQGGFRWLLGPSGAGKSSLLRLLHLEALPQSGELEILGTHVGVGVKRATLARLRQRVGMVHQDFRLMPTLSISDNVALPLRLERRDEAAVADEVAAILRWVGLSERSDALPAELSGGEQQRAAIARAVIARPGVVLADEPTNALEESQSSRIVGMLREVSTLGATVIVATHNDALVRRFPAPALRLERGRLTSDESNAP
ncbi:ATP-binding cassette domain-containing protein [Acetobacter sacchari]|uniref:ATP-binding cassette domain-containing protein n=1 Tax=Acetobacter sacchari TaxID=2661687 RepID=A0ABS3M086_9PROT|nr:ATP-binding cassette domain-containing protein [Acetobacter sacchari]MBO1361570.1 ATP-binding cassette domain-containing protein [Acetobacter sacchari]